jgi:Domain of unknown function (DUF4156)
VRRSPWIPKPFEARNQQMTLHMAHLTLITSVLFITACSTPELTPMGRGVIALGTPPGEHCRALGLVTGEGRGPYSPGSLVEYATNDARNRAAELGATHVHTMPPALGYSANYTSGSSGGQGAAGVSSATLTGTAYRCVDEPLVESVAPRGIFATVGPMPSGATNDTQIPRPLPAIEESIRATLDLHRREILACVARDMVVVEVAYDGFGDATISLSGDLVQSAEERCVRVALGRLHIDHSDGAHTVRHLVRQP